MGHQIVDDNTEEIKLKVPDTSAVPTRFTRKFNNPDTCEFSTNSRKLRVTLNKVTEENFQKLLKELIESLSFDEKLLSEFLRLVFERASKGDTSNLYLKIVVYFFFLLESKFPISFKTLKTCMKLKIDSILSTPVQISTLRFIGKLYQEHLIESSLISQYLTNELTKLSSDSQNKETVIESLCTLIESVAPHLVLIDSDLIESAFQSIQSSDTRQMSPKTQFLVQGTLERKPVLMTKASQHVPMFHESPQHKSSKRVSFITTNDFQPVVSNRTKRILRHSVNEAIKENIRNIVDDYVKGKKDLEPFEKLFSSNANLERPIVNQIFKYALIQFNREQEFLIICEIFCRVSGNVITREVVETGISNTVEAVEDIKLDSPMAKSHLGFMINLLKQREVLRNSEDLIRHMERPILRKQSESSIENCPY
jgi:hypothetical protein